MKKQNAFTIVKLPAVSKSKRNAFTLVELLVVIGIIALLISILLPALNKARASANEVVCQSRIRQFAAGLQMYVTQSKGVMPYKGPDGSNTTSNFFGPSGGVIGVDDPCLWFNAIPKMVGNKTYSQMLIDHYKGLQRLPQSGDNNIFVCPSAGARGSISSKDIIGDGDYFLLNGIDSQNRLEPGIQTFRFNMSYVFNSKFGDPPYPQGSGTTLQPPIKINMLKPSWAVPVMVEKLVNSGEYMDKDVQTWINGTGKNVWGTTITPMGLNNNVSQPKSNWKRFTTRHRGGGYILFADGHVAWFSWKELQAQPQGATLPDANTDCNQYGKCVWNPWGPIN